MHNIFWLFYRYNYWNQWKNCKDKKLNCFNSLRYNLWTFAVYSSWVIWLFELFQRQGWTFNPVTILHIMQFLSIEGVWSSGSFTPTGFLLYIICFVVAAIIVGGCIYASSTYIKNDAFCEKCNAWVVDKHKLPNLNYTYNSTKLKNLLHQGQFSALSDLKIQDPPNDSYTAVELSKCSNCDELYLLTVNIVEIIKIRWEF